MLLQDYLEACSAVDELVREGTLASAEARLWERSTDGDLLRSGLEA